MSSERENGKREIYLDNAATTRMPDVVKEAMEPYLGENFGNASTMYRYGEEAREALERTRKIIADTLEAKPSEIYFTRTTGRSRGLRASRKRRDAILSRAGLNIMRF